MSVSKVWCWNRKSSKTTKISTSNVVVDAGLAKRARQGCCLLVHSHLALASSSSSPPATCTERRTTTIMAVWSSFSSASVCVWACFYTFTSLQHTQIRTRSLDLWMEGSTNEWNGDEGKGKGSKQRERRKVIRLVARLCC